MLRRLLSRRGALGVIATTGAGAACSYGARRFQNLAPKLTETCPPRPSLPHVDTSRARLALRAAVLLWSFLYVALCLPLAVLSKDFREGSFYEILASAIRHSRSAALTKWSQWASVRMDLFPAALCRQLEQFADRAPMHS